MRTKLSHRWFLLPLLGLGACAGLANEPSNVRIEFVHPERFSDLQIQGRQEVTSAPIFRNQIASYLSPYVARRFPGATLTLKFTNIDLAGRLEWWRIRKFNDVRFDRTMGANPLRLYFDYTLTDSKGRVLANGSKAIVDGDYINRYVYYPNIQKADTLFYEKVTLYRWLDYLTARSLLESDYHPPGAHTLQAYATIGRQQRSIAILPVQSASKNRKRRQTNSTGAWG
jgi:hypothetical protein